MNFYDNRVDTMPTGTLAVLQATTHTNLFSARFIARTTVAATLIVNVDADPSDSAFL